MSAWVGWRSVGGLGCLVLAACAPAGNPAGRAAADRLPDVPEGYATVDEAAQAARLRVHDVGGQPTLFVGRMTAEVTGDYLALRDDDGPFATVGLVALGREQGRTAVMASEAVVEGPQVRFDRGDVLEWYHHREEGLQQGFSVRARPEGDGPVALEVAIDGLRSAAVALGPAGERALFRDAMGVARLAVSGVYAEDATGRPLAAELDADCEVGCRVVLRVDDTDALYPLMVDPLYTSPSTVIDGDSQAGASSGFGKAVSADGDRVVIGAPGVSLSQGVVVVLERNAGGVGLWGVEDTIVGSGLTGFGSAVAIDLPWLVVGAEGSTEARVYHFEAGNWVQDPITGVLAPSSSQLSFGASVGIYGNLVTVGGASGPVDVFLAESGQHLVAFGSQSLGYDIDWPLAAQRQGGSVSLYVAPDDLAHTFSAQAGEGVVVDDGRVAWGEPDHDRVQVATMERLSDGSYAVASLVEVPRPAAFPDAEGFGASVDLLGQTLVVSDRGPGTAHVHLFDLDGTWAHRESFPAGPVGDDVAVALSARTLAIGQPADGVAGTAQVLERNADYLVAGLINEGDVNARTGEAVAIDDPYAVVGLPTYAPGYAVTGAVRVYEHEAGGWTLHQSLQGSEDGSEFGAALALHNEVLVVGEPGSNRAQIYGLEEGRFEPKHELSGPGGAYGSAVAVENDLVAVSAPRASGQLGNVEVSKIDPGTFAPIFTTSIVGTVASGRIGESLDIDNARLAYGSPSVDGAEGTAAVRAIEVSIAGLTMGPEYAAEQSNQADWRCGTDVALEGDWLLVGCPSRNAGAGRVQVYTTDGTSWAWVQDLQTGTAGANQFGFSVAMDGALAAVGAPLRDGVRLYGRNVAGDEWGEIGALTVEGSTGTEFGHAVALENEHLVVGVPGAISDVGEVHFFELDADLPPTARDDELTVDEDVGGTLDVLANDFDGDGVDLTIELVDVAALGSATLNGSSDAIVYSPFGDASGTDTVTYQAVDSDGLRSELATVTIHIQPVNDAPTVPVLPVYSVFEDALTQVNAAEGLLSWVEDIDSAPAELQVDTTGALTTAQSGTLTVAADGSFTYLPAQDFVGIDTVAVTLSDGQAVTDPDPVIVTFDVVESAEPPVLVARLFTVEGDVLRVPAPGLLEGGRAPQGPRQWQITPNSKNEGELTIDASGAMTYTRGSPLSGADSFDVVLSVAGLPSEPVQVSFSLAENLLPPVGVPDAYGVALGDVLDVDYGSLNAAVGVLRNDESMPGAPVSQAVPVGALPAGVELATNGGLRYATSTAGTVSFEYVAQSSGGDSQPTEVTIEVLPTAAGGPVASDDSYDTGARQLTVSAADGLLANDAGQGALVALLAGPTEGLDLQLQADGSFVAVARTMPGVGRFTYRVSDGSFVSEPATVTIDFDDGSGSTGTGPTGTRPTDDLPCTTAYYIDADGDGHGDERLEAVLACAAGPGLADTAGDCDDADAGVHPGAPEIGGDGVDQDCDGRDAALAPSGACQSAPALPWPLLWMPLVFLVRRRQGGAA